MLPDFFIALTAAVEHVRAGILNEAEVQHEVQNDDGVTTLTVTIRRYDTEHLRVVLEADGDE